MQHTMSLKCLEDWSLCPPLTLHHLVHNGPAAAGPADANGAAL